MIEIKHLTKQYGSHTAVEDLNLTLEPGKIYGFLGPNGAGKSTTMNMITGYLGATEGEVKINGYDIFKQPEEAKQCIGYLPELPPLYQEMTVSEYLYFVAELKKIKKADRKAEVENVIEKISLKDVENRLIRNLSKGYKQRVGLAQAILGNPDFIILDEPTVGLDPKQILEIRDLIKELGQEHTVILSSHILTEISAVCEHVFIISKGKLVASDTTENLVGLMSGSQEIELVVKGGQTEAEQILDTVGNVSKKEVLSAEKEEETRILVHSTQGADIREGIFQAFADSKIPILEMHTVTKSLEDVFLELTQEGEQKS
ncbi:MAG: ABC transporter ATP-binding protein [Agathobacter sp.]|nr:ABC transporter ATP-binding protein [Agathobacter sp.]MBQ2282994.1 ABC transporter ATP-binding protein [Agathobacter sp.]